MKATDLAQEFANAGVEAIICTEILVKMVCLWSKYRLHSKILQIQVVSYTIASGGVKDINDIKACKENGNVGGVIVNFSEGTLDLEKKLLKFYSLTIKIL